MPRLGKSLEQELRDTTQHQETNIRDILVTGKMPNRSCILFDRDKTTLEHKAAGEQGFSTAHKSKSLNTVAFHKSACVAV